MSLNIPVTSATGKLEHGTWAKAYFAKNCLQGTAQKMHKHVDACSVDGNLTKFKPRVVGD